MNKKFKDKVVLVTGASRGIGKAIAQSFARQGAITIGTATTQKSVDGITKYLSDSNGHGLILNLNDKKTFEDFSKQLENIAPPQIIVNNAGITRDNLLMRMKDEQWEDVLKTNLTGMFKVSRLCLRAMMKSRYGRIINITSVVGLSGNVGQTNYAATKAGVIGFTRSLAREVGTRGITVNAVAPGFIETDMTNSLDQNMRDTMLKQIAQGRFGKPEEIASVVDFIASDEAAYITGQTISVNGGMYMG